MRGPRRPGRPRARRLALYQGDLLEGLSVEEPPFEEWLIAERVRLRELALEALARLLAQQRDAGALEQAVQTALRLVALDPLQEPVHRTLMRLYAAARPARGRAAPVPALRRRAPARAARRARGRDEGALPGDPSAAAGAPASRAVDVLALATAERGDPEAELHAAALVRRIAAGRAGGRAGAASGRAAGRLAGRGQLVAVIGEAGIGKSRLVAELAVEAAERVGAPSSAGATRASRCCPSGRGSTRCAPAASPTTSEMLEPARPGVAGRAGPAPSRDRRAAAGRRPPRSRPALRGDRSAPRARGPRSARAPHPRGPPLGRRDEPPAPGLHRAVASVGGACSPSSTAREEDLAESTLLRHTLDELDQGGHLVRLSLGSLSRDETVALARTLVPPRAAAPRGAALASERGQPVHDRRDRARAARRLAARGHVGAAAPRARPQPDRESDRAARRAQPPAGGGRGGDRAALRLRRCSSARPISERPRRPRASRSWSATGSCTAAARASSSRTTASARSCTASSCPAPRAAPPPRRRGARAAPRRRARRARARPRHALPRGPGLGRRRSSISRRQGAGLAALRAARRGRLLRAGAGRPRPSPREPRDARAGRRSPVQAGALALPRGAVRARDGVLPRGRAPGPRPRRPPPPRRRSTPA